MVRNGKGGRCEIFGYVLLFDLFFHNGREGFCRL